MHATNRGLSSTATAASATAPSSSSARPRDDVRLLAAVGEDAVDALVGPDVLAQRGDGVVAEHRGVEGVAALVREGGGVGGLALVVDEALVRRRSTSIDSRSAPAGWTIIAASTPSRAPRSPRCTLPPPPSSAGVPRTTTRPPSSSASAAAARPAPSPAVPMMLCPQAWPMPGQGVVLAAARRWSGLRSRRGATKRGVEPVGVALDVDARRRRGVRSAGRGRSAPRS